MVFSSLLFLLRFLPLTLFLYYIVPRRFRNLILFAASLLFYAWGEPVYVCLILSSTFIDYIAGRIVGHYKTKGRIWKAKAGVAASAIINLGLLGIFKYADFFLSTVNEWMHMCYSLPHLALPIGISFYTFQTMSYTIDVYRGDADVQKNFITFGTYVSLFPQLIAGPIIRYKTVEKQLTWRKENIALFADGIFRFIIGLGKKVLIANQIGELWNETAVVDISMLSTMEAWLGAVAFTFQIYFDFSGYSDMAIGLGQMFGFTFPENFIYPYEAKNITDFWRRWHITLGAWFREYIYIPLGGNRRGLQRQLANLFVVWLLTGLWHGASWNFALWGIYFFVLLVAEKVFLLKEMEHWPQVMRHIYGKFFIVVGWVLFAIEDFDNMGYYLQVMFGIKNSLVNEAAGYYLQTYGILLVIMAVASTRIPIRLMNRLRRYLVREEPEFAVKKGKSVEFVLYSLYTFIILLISIGMLISGSYNPFLYFRF